MSPHRPADGPTGAVCVVTDGAGQHAACLGPDGLGISASRTAQQGGAP